MDSGTTRSFLKGEIAYRSAMPLALFNLALPNVVPSDTSNVTLGTALHQQHRDGHRIVCLASRSLTLGERNFSAGEKEAPSFL